MKCGNTSCQICKPVRLDLEVFKSLHYLPDSVPGDDGHNKSFEELYGTTTTEQYRPSTRKPTREVIGFTPSQQHIKNVGVLVQCEECDKWRCIFCKHKLTHQEVSNLEKILEESAYTCGVLFSNLELSGRLKNVCVKDHRCTDPIEKLYYSCGFEPICLCDLISTGNDDSAFLPMCSECEESGVNPIKKPVTKEK